MHFKRVILASCLAVVGVANAQVTTNIYSGHSTNNGGGAPYTGFTGTLQTPDVQFGTSTGFNWHPFNLSVFGADITGVLSVPSTNSWTFQLNSDDGSLLFIDGNQVVNDGGAHGVTAVSNSVTLTAGLHPFEVQFYEDFGGSSGVDLNLPTGVTFAPEPNLLPLLGLGGGVLLVMRRRRRG